MPTHQGLGPDDRDCLKDQREPSIQLDQKQPIVVCEPDPAAHLTAQHHKLMPKRHVLCFKADLRPEWRDHDRKHEAYKRKHHINLCDSLTSSTRIRFSVHTASNTDFFARIRASVITAARCLSIL
jgi:hypothetical protein